MKAVILAAGMGTRLNPLTKGWPKCLVEINGESILESGLKHLDRCGIEETVIVVGYAKDKIIEKIGNSYGAMNVNYLVNDIFDKTNNMYSLWLARDYLEEGCILIEGDVIFEIEILSRLMSLSNDRSFWVVDRFAADMNGCMIKTKDGGLIQDIRIIREKPSFVEENSFKSVGMLKIAPDFGKLLSQWLSLDVVNENVNIYYDLIISKNIHNYPLYIFEVDGAKWFEVDDINDLRQAEEIFDRC